MKCVACVDAGTTNIQACLGLITDKGPAEYVTVRNTQAIYGEDVVTRLAGSLKKPAIKEAVRKTILEDISSAVNSLLEKCRGGGECLERIVVCGNPVMHHIILGLPLENLAYAPFEPAYKAKIFKTTVRGSGLHIKNEKAEFIFLPNIGGFVGSDALGVAADTGMHRSSGAVLAVDLGTNGEILLGNKTKIVAASASAGPAFATNGVDFSLNASDAVDAVSILLKNKDIETNGFMPFKEKILRLRGKKIKITQKDIRRIQLAKAAVRAGIDILRKHMPGEIKKVVLTGLFGSHVDVKKAVSIKLLPEDIGARMVMVRERSALCGAWKLAKSRDIDKDVRAIVSKIEHVELHKDPEFQDIFAGSMGF